MPGVRPGRLAERLEIHHTPKHGSWFDPSTTLGAAEVELATLGRRPPDRVDDAATLARHVAAVEEDARRGCVWRFTAADARAKLASLYPTIEPR